MATDGMNHGLSAGYDAAVAPEETETTMITIISDIVGRAGGRPEQIRAEDLDGNNLALFYDTHEWARISKSEENLWIEFFLTPALRNEYAVDKRFSDVANKESDRWRIALGRPEDLREFADIIVKETI